jgi:hypothetical protein
VPALCLSCGTSFLGRADRLWDPNTFDFLPQTFLFAPRAPFTWKQPAPSNGVAAGRHTSPLPRHSYHASAGACRPLAAQAPLRHLPAVRHCGLAWARTAFCGASRVGSPQFQAAKPNRCNLCSATAHPTLVLTILGPFDALQQGGGDPRSPALATRQSSTLLGVRQSYSSLHAAFSQAPQRSCALLQLVSH